MGERLERRTHRRAPCGIQQSADEKAPVLRRVQAEPAFIREPLLVSLVPAGVHRMPVVDALVEELPRRVLAGDRKQLRLLEGRPDLVGGPGHGREVGEPDRAGLHRLQGLRELGFLRAHREGVPDLVRVEMTVDADPIEGGVEAFVRPQVGLVERHGESREAHLHLVDLLAQGDELLGDVFAGDHVVVLNHVGIIANTCLESNVLNRPNPEWPTRNHGRYSRA